MNNSEPFPNFVAGLQQGASLDVRQIRVAVDALLSPQVSAQGKADFLLALHERGETPEEVSGFVVALLEHARKPSLPAVAERPRIDVCGTGGDKSGLFNVSTATMFVVAAAGADVVKHGNRGITSKSGGADVLEALGFPVELPPEAAGEFLQKHGFVFLFAPTYHPAFREIAPVRKQLAAQGKTTIFNILGPLLNPARPDYQLAGVFQKNLLPLYRDVFRLLGRRGAWAVHGSAPDGSRLDELSPCGVSFVSALSQGKELDFEISPEALGLTPCRIEDLRGGDPAHNAMMIRAILHGEERGAPRSAVLLNAAGALCACSLAESLEAGVAKAAEVLDSGAAAKSLPN